MSTIEKSPGMPKEESEDWGQILPRSLPNTQTHQFLVFIEGARNIVPSYRPYLLCMYNHQEARFGRKNDLDNEEELEGDTLNPLSRITSKGKEVSGSGDGIYGSANPISIPSPGRSSISGYLTGSKPSPMQADPDQITSEMMQRMSEKRIRDLKWKSVMVIDVSMAGGGSSVLNLHIFDAGQRDAFRGQAHLYLDKHVKRRASLSLRPRIVSDNVAGEIMLTIYPVRSGICDIRSSFERLNIHRFQNLGNIGEGSLGRVHRILDRSSGTVYAMKLINSFDLMTSEPQSQLRLVPAYSPFVAGRKFALQSATELRIFVDYIPGGELFKVSTILNRFAEKEIKFYIAEILLGLGDLHSWGIQDYSLRPKKILLDSLGHIVLSDFGLTVASGQTEKKVDAYSAPETFSRSREDHLQNFWSLGIILLEMLVGYNPLQFNNIEKTKRAIVDDIDKLPGTDRLLARSGRSEEVRDLCHKLLRRNPQKRLGSDGIDKIKRHSFFVDIDWEDLRAKRVEPPLKPSVEFDLTNVWEGSIDNLADMFEESINIDTRISAPTLSQVSDSFSLSTRYLSVNSETANSYHSALSHDSPSTHSVYATPSSRIQSLARGSGPAEGSLLTKLFSRSDKGLNPDSEFGKLLQERGLLLPPSEQLDWSGRGQHVEFRVNEPIPLKPLAAVGHGGSAMVDSVLCRRIKLARKVMVCNRRQKLETMINEVEHLQRLRHPHIVQLVGSYIQGRRFAILLYPVADWNLATFYELCGAEEEVNTSATNVSRFGYLNALSGFFPCLAHGLAYIHSNTMKHLDVKPQNILVRKIANDEKPFRIYLADFGISKKFADDNMSQTDGLIAKSRKYCSPEVYDGEPRGRAADVFSLGCVFLEMATILCNDSLEQFADYRSQNGDGEDSFHDNLRRVEKWIEYLRVTIQMSLELGEVLPIQNVTGILGTPSLKPLLDVIRHMLEFNPEVRPLASDVLNTFGGAQKCCLATRESYVEATIDDNL